MSTDCCNTCKYCCLKKETLYRGEIFIPQDQVEYASHIGNGMKLNLKFAVPLERNDEQKKPKRKKRRKKCKKCCRCESGEKSSGRSRGKYLTSEGKNKANARFTTSSNLHQNGNIDVERRDFSGSCELCCKTLLQHLRLSRNEIRFEGDGNIRNRSDPGGKFDQRELELRPSSSGWECEEKRKPILLSDAELSESNDAYKSWHNKNRFVTEASSSRNQLMAKRRFECEDEGEMRNVRVSSHGRSDKKRPPLAGSGDEGESRNARSGTICNCCQCCKPTEGNTLQNGEVDEKTLFLLSILAAIGEKRKCVQ